MLDLVVSKDIVQLPTLRSATMSEAEATAAPQPAAPAAAVEPVKGQV
jgi:hypothetical protein